MAPAGGSRLSIDDWLEQARRRFRRATPEAARAALDRGALLVDTRPIAQRVAHGEIPGAIVIDRNVLEWRLDPACAHAIPEARTGRPIILYCQEGYSTSLAVASLLDCGVADVTDLEGGFEAWKAAGLPVVPVGECPGGE